MGNSLFAPLSAPSDPTPAAPLSAPPSVSSLLPIPKILDETHKEDLEKFGVSAVCQIGLITAIVCNTDHCKKKLAKKHANSFHGNEVDFTNYTMDLRTQFTECVNCKEKLPPPVLNFLESKFSPVPAVSPSQ